MTPLQKSTAQAIVNVVETGNPDGDYCAVSVIDGDDSHLRYGRAEIALAGGQLASLVAEYCAAPGATCAEALRPFLERLTAADLTLDRDSAFCAALVVAGADPVMRELQDRFVARSGYHEPYAGPQIAGISIRPIGVRGLRIPEKPRPLGH